MGLILNLILSIMVIVLGVFPNIFVVVGSSNRNWYDRLTKYGIILIVLMIVVIVMTIINEIIKDRESAKNQCTLENINDSVMKDYQQNLSLLTDIQNALKEANLGYNSEKKAIINNNITNISKNPTGNLLGIVVDGNGKMGNVTMTGNEMNTNMVMEYHEFMGTLTQARVKLGIKGRQVYIGNFAGTSGKRYMPEIEKVLVDNGYKIIDRIYDVPPYLKYNTEGVKVDTKDGQLFLIVGDLSYPPYH